MSPNPGSTNTWFTVLLHNPPNNKNVDKYLKKQGIKLQASHLVPVDADYKPIPIATLTATAEAQDGSSTGAASSSSSSSSSSSNGKTNSKAKSSSEGNATAASQGNASGSSKAGTLLSTTGPITHWVGRKVKITVGKQRGLEAYVTGSGNGWVQLQYMDGDKEATFLDGDTTPLECAKRSTFCILFFFIIFFFVLFHTYST